MSTTIVEAPALTPNARALVDAGRAAWHQAVAQHTPLHVDHP